MPTAEQIAQMAAQQQFQAQQEKAAKEAMLNNFMFNTVSRIYAGMVVRYGQDVPLEQLAQSSQNAAEVLAQTLGLLPKPTSNGKVVTDEK